MSSMALELIAKEDYSKFSKPKYIGYNPINIFTQTEPLNYPYVKIWLRNQISSKRKDW